ncbi:MAG: preprotein translocase subunit SecE [Candidatus Babeliales bacterium]
MNKVLAFLNEVKSEIFKITWPSKDELIGSTIIVCFLTIVFAIILGGMDAVIGMLIRKLISF